MLNYWLVEAQRRQPNNAIERKNTKNHRASEGDRWRRARIAYVQRWTGLFSDGEFRFQWMVFGKATDAKHAEA